MDRLIGMARAAERPKFGGRVLKSGRWCWVATALLICITLGCGKSLPETANVTGQVTLDGKPIAGAAVMLIPTQGGRNGIGVTDGEGRFVIGTFEPADGALLGSHRIVVTLQTIKDLAKLPAEEAELERQFAGKAPPVEWIVPPRYGNPDTSGLTVDVGPAMPELELELLTKKQ